MPVRVQQAAFLFFSHLHWRNTIDGVHFGASRHSWRQRQGASAPYRLGPWLFPMRCTQGRRASLFCAQLRKKGGQRMMRQSLQRGPHKTWLPFSYATPGAGRRAVLILIGLTTSFNIALRRVFFLLWRFFEHRDNGVQKLHEGLKKADDCGEPTRHGFSVSKRNQKGKR